MNVIRNFIREYVTVMNELPALLAGMITLCAILFVVFFVIVSIDHPVLPVIILSSYGLGRWIKRLAGRHS